MKVSTTPPERSTRRDRRRYLIWGTTLGLGLWQSAARAGLGDAGPLKMGVESALMISGLALHLKKGIGADLGLPVTLMPAPSLTLLDQLQAGEVDVAITQAPEREAGLEQQGLAFFAKTIGHGRYVLAGTGADAAGVQGHQDVVQALSDIARVGQAGGCTFVAASEPDGTREMEKTLWKAVGPRPLGRWMQPAPAQALGILQTLRQLQAQKQSAYGLVEQGVWLAQGGKPLTICVEGDARLDAPYRIASSYRTQHPAAKFICGYLGGASGHRLVERFGHGYHA